MVIENLQRVQRILEDMEKSKGVLIGYYDKEIANAISDIKDARSELSKKAQMSFYIPKNFMEKLCNAKQEIVAGDYSFCRHGNFEKMLIHLENAKNIIQDILHSASKSRPLTKLAVLEVEIEAAVKKYEQASGIKVSWIGILHDSDDSSISQIDINMCDAEIEEEHRNTNTESE